MAGQQRRTKNLHSAGVLDLKTDRLPGPDSERRTGGNNFEFWAADGRVGDTHAKGSTVQEVWRSVSCCGRPPPCQNPIVGLTTTRELFRHIAWSRLVKWRNQPASQEKQARLQELARQRRCGDPSLKDPVVGLRQRGNYCQKYCLESPCKVAQPTSVPSETTKTARANQRERRSFTEGLSFLAVSRVPIRRGMCSAALHSPHCAECPTTKQGQCALSFSN